MLVQAKRKRKKEKRKRKTGTKRSGSERNSIVQGMWLERREEGESLYVFTYVVFVRGGEEALSISDVTIGQRDGS